MSWDAYVDNIIQQTGDPRGDKHCDRAAIIGLDGGALWTATSPSCLKITAQEGAAIAACFKSNNFTSFQASGIYVEGLKYQFLRQDDTAIFGRHKDQGLTLQKTKTAIVCGHMPSGKQQGFLNKGVDVVAKYLESMNM